MIRCLIIIGMNLNIIFSKHPHVGKSALEIIHINKYPTETHNVITKDGYILTLFRIPHGIKNRTRNGRPVLLMHGIIQSAADFVVMGSNKSIAFILAENGYDVWLGNARGNLYSRNHTDLSAKNKKFWKFSWHEIGLFDLPAMINYILDKTGYAKLHYMGHSQGCTTLLVLLSSKPKYNEKINLGVMLAPCSFMTNIINPFIYFFVNYFYEETVFLMETLSSHNGEFLSHHKNISKIIEFICAFFSKICSSILFLIIGFSYRLLNYELLPAILSNLPAGISYLQTIHFAQIIKSGHFRRFDYGERINKKKYGTKTPPDYDLKKIRAPMAIFYSDYDWICSTKDVEKLSFHLPNVAYKKKITEEIFNHMDFIWNSINFIQYYYLGVMN
ncbi:lipase 3-like [Onthophagus taurus]|uniref:lipase 3-like n=1 Tax=Onthophagus taurus TaxID=166361 RepID=UPI0039BDB6D4